MSSLDVARAELGLAVLYLNKAEARDKICRAIQYGSKFVSDGEPGTAQNVEKSTSLARKVFRLFKVLLVVIPCESHSLDSTALTGSLQVIFSFFPQHEVSFSWQVCLNSFKGPSWL